MTFATIGTSTTSESMLRGEAESVGFDNVDALFDDPEFWPSIGFALSLALLPILVALVAGPLVAAAVDWAGGWARWLVRAALSAALVVVLTRLRVSVRPLRSPREKRPVNAGAIVVALLAIIAVVAVAVLTMGPWLFAGVAPLAVEFFGDRARRRRGEHRGRADAADPGGHPAVADHGGPVPGRRNAGSRAWAGSSARSCCPHCHWPVSCSW